MLPHDTHVQMPRQTPREIAVVTLPLAGHINPMRAVVDELVARGHRVTLIGPPGMGELMPGVAFRAISDADYPAGRMTELLTLLPTIRGLRGVRRMIAEIAALSALYIRQLPAALGAVEADLVLSDQLEPAAGLVARGLGLAHASLSCALPMNRGEDIPPPYLGWRYRAEGRSAAYGRWLNQGGYRVVDAMMAPQGDVLERGADHFGLARAHLAGGGRTVDDWVSPTTDLSQCIPGLDYPRAGAPQEGRPHEVGPIRPRRRLAPLDIRRDGRDLVFCTLGTLMGARLEIFEAVARAAHALDVQLLVAHGGRLPTAAQARLAAMPGSPVLRDFVDQASVLSEAKACVLHGGFNSVIDALSCGVPMVVLPLAFEQRAIAARVERSGAGRVVRPGSRKAIRRALSDALGNRAMRMAALELAASAAQAGGLNEVVARIIAAPAPDSGTRPDTVVHTHGRQGERA